MFSENGIAVLNCLKANDGKDVTAADIAEMTGLPKKTVDGIVTSALQRKGLSVRVPAQVEATAEDGTTKYVDIKLIQLTDEGRAIDPIAANEAEAAAKEAEKLAKAEAKKKAAADAE